MSDLIKEMDKAWSKVDFDKIKKESDKLIEKAKEALEHPHFYYACIDTENKIIYIKPKPFWKWFSGKKQLAIKIVPFPTNSEKWFAGTVSRGGKRYNENESKNS